MFKPGKIAVVVLTFICVAAIGKSRLHAQQKLVADKVVAVVGNSSVLYSDVYKLVQDILEERRQQRVTSDRNVYCEALENLMMQRLLYNQALVDSLDVGGPTIDLAVTQQINNEIATHGSIAALEAFYGKPKYIIEQELKSMYVEMQGAGMMEQTIRDKVKINHAEVEKYYKDMTEAEIPIVPEQYVYAHIVKMPVAAAEAKMRTREQMLGLRQRIINGEDFGALALIYSVDPGSAMRRGEMEPMDKDNFVRPFAEALGRLQVNQVSEVVETEHGFHIIQLLGRVGSMYRARHILMKPEYTTAEIQESVNIMDSILTQINSGAMTFEEAARKHSDDKYSRENDGIVTNQEDLERSGNLSAAMLTSKFFTENLNPDDSRALRGMQSGDISASFQTRDLMANTIVKAVMLKEIIPAHPATLKDDFKLIEQVALRKKQDDEFKKWMTGKIEGMYVRVDDDFKNCEFEFPEFLK